MSSPLTEDCFGNKQPLVNRDYHLATRACIKAAVEGLRSSVERDLDHYTPYRPVLDTDEMRAHRKSLMNVLTEIDNYFPVFSAENLSVEESVTPEEFDRV